MACIINNDGKFYRTIFLEEAFFVKKKYVKKK